jgi:hypothetical protein
MEELPLVGGRSFAYDRFRATNLTFAGRYSRDRTGEPSSMITGLTYLLVSLAVALLMPRLISTRGHDENGEAETYGYSIQFGRFFLVVIVLAGVALATACISWRPTGRGSAWVLPGFALLGVGIPSLFYAYVSSYRVRIDERQIEVHSAFGRRSVDWRPSLL